MAPLVPKIELPPVLIPVFLGQADIRWAAGGRGGGKSWAFSKMAAVKGAMLDQEGHAGVILCIRQFMNSLDDSSLQDIKSAIFSDPWLASVYEVGEKYVRTKSGRIKFIFAGTSVNLGSIKSKSRIRLCLAEEAEQIPSDAWEKIIPTIREEGSELWAIYNPESERAWVHKNLRMSDDPLIKGAIINWSDNPWFTDKMNRDRLRAKENDPDNYEHIWEGGFKTVTKGAYYTRQIADMKAEGRLTRVTADPLMTIRLVADIGGTGARADNFVFWAMQYVGREIRVLNHYERQGQPIAAHLKWMREQGYDPGTAEIWLPHDGDNHDKVYDVTYRSAFEDAGYTVTVVPNQGKGAAMLRVEATRRCFPMIWMDEEKTKTGLPAIVSYASKLDEDRGIDLGPDHNWASHSADAFGLGCVVYEEPKIAKKKRAEHVVSWMG